MIYFKIIKSYNIYELLKNMNGLSVEAISLRFLVQLL